jgi:nucleoside-diphosphate-sugar epimerase
MGYVGPSVGRRLRRSEPKARLIGFDAGYFAHCLTGPDGLPERDLDEQRFGDVRRPPAGLLDGVDAVVHLAAISNDPMGNTFEAVTNEINYRASVDLARAAKAAGVRRFVFASSCSMYGFAEGAARVEQDPLNPLTAYARSKVAVERDLATLASDDFVVTSLRFATACGMSERLRLDLVLNDFVAGAVLNGEIGILSDGTPWRPLIHVDDMARAIDWAVHRDAGNGGTFVAVNAGSDEWNYRVAELAEAVGRAIPGVKISTNKHAVPDKRSYRVDFGLYRTLAPGHQPQVDLAEAIRVLRDGIARLGLRNGDFRNSTFIRLKVLSTLRENGLLNERLEWRQREEARA